jgi:hypothetical protein
VNAVSSWFTRAAADELVGAVVMLENADSSVDTAVEQAGSAAVPRTPLGSPVIPVSGFEPGVGLALEVTVGDEDPPGVAVALVPVLVHAAIAAAIAAEPAAHRRVLHRSVMAHPFE